MGPQSLPGGGQGRETFDATLYAGVRPWQGAQVWINPELDQGFGFDNTHGLAGFVSGEAFKLGFSYPYARLQRLFLRQTINLGGDVSKLDADINQFADTVMANRLVLTVGRMAAAFSTSEAPQLAFCAAGRYLKNCLPRPHKISSPRAVRVPGFKPWQASWGPALSRHDANDDVGQSLDCARRRPERV